LYVAFGYLGWAQQHHKIVSGLFSKSEMSFIAPTSPGNTGADKSWKCVGPSSDTVTIVPSGPSDHVTASGGGSRKTKTKSVSFRTLMRSSSVGVVMRDATILFLL